MSKVHRLTDRIEYEIGDLKVKIAPFSLADKTLMMSYVFESNSKKDPLLMFESNIYALRCAIKDVKGLIDSNGEEYKLQFGDDGKLTRDCAQDLMNIEQSLTLINFCGALVNGVNTENLPKGISLVKKEDEEKNLKAQI